MNFMNFMTTQRCFEEEIPENLPFLEVWLNEFTTIYEGIKEQ
jgi:hypothetical protein